MTMWFRFSVIATAALLLGGCLGGEATEGEIEAQIANMGFTVLQPPSNLYMPGSLVYRSNYDPKETKPTKVVLGFLCNREFSVDLYAKQPMSSPTTDQATITKFGGNISAGIPALTRVINLNAKLNAASTINVRIHDVKVYAFALDDLEAIKGKLGPVCRQIVNGHVPSNAYQVIQALEATVDVTVQIGGGGSVAAQAAFAKQLGNLGFEVSADQTATLKGMALLFGVQLIQITSPIEPPAPAVASTGQEPGAPKTAARSSLSARPAASLQTIRSYPAETFAAVY